MGFRFFRRMRLLPGVSVNLSKSGASLSFGVRGAHYTVGPRGRRVTVGLPGTGMYYTAQRGAARPRAGRRPATHATSGRVSPAEAASVPVAPAVRPEDRLRLGLLRSLVTPPEERELVAGLRAFVSGREDEALAHLRGAATLPDAAFMAGMLLVKQGSLDDARSHLDAALAGESALGSVVAKYKADASFNLAVTPELTAHLPLTGDGVRLALAEIDQRQGRAEEAAKLLRDIRARHPDDVIVALSLAELLFDTRASDRAALNEIVQLTDNTRNESPVHTALLLYRARALRVLDLPDAAAATLTTALAQKNDRDAELLKSLRYERALALDAAGQHARARRELEKLYADDPRYEDIASRLGLAGPPPPSAAAPT
ncbi:MAG: DUF4236 domain-containing protein [Chloroflexota bacterium]|nr:DUF4236 domain-containing protein [Chloroflexota bacterium]